MDETLSDKEVVTTESYRIRGFKTSDIIKFISDLKAECNDRLSFFHCDICKEKFNDIVKELAGEKLLTPTSLTPIGSANHSPQKRTEPFQEGNALAFTSEGTNDDKDVFEQMLKDEDTNNSKGCGVEVAKGFYCNGIILCPKCSKGEENDKRT